MRLYAFAVYLFLYLPIGVIALFSFNAGRHATQLTGFSLQWYGKALSNPFVIEALQTSFIVAFTSALLATICGTLAAVALQGVRGRLRLFYDALIYMAVMVPGIVIGIATLIALVTLFGVVNPALTGVFGQAAPQLGLGKGSLIAAHGLFTMSLVIVTVRARLQGMDRSLLEAASDLGAPPMRAFWQIVLPQIAPAVLAGFLLAFTFSFDDFVIAFFTAGSETTLPIYVFSSIRRGVTPEINAIGSLVLAASLVMLVAAQLILRKRGR